MQKLHSIHNIAEIEIFFNLEKRKLTFTTSQGEFIILFLSLWKWT